MNKKALSLAICMALAFPAATNALSLGDIESSSSLNQPFKGKINLLSTSIAEAKTLRVKVAPPEVFNRVGIDRPAFLNSIRFRTTIQNGRPVILVSSSQPINEPFLNFLLEVSWPNGQLLKEYTVLLDPPVLLRPDTAIASNTAGIRPEPGRAQPVQRAAQQRRVVQQPKRVVRAAAPAQRRATPQPRRATPVKRVASTSQSRSYRVRRGDNLYKVARKLGYRGIQKEQMMVALYEKNRRAFIKNNMNNLKAGAVLSRPSLNEVRTLSPRKAKSLILAQAREWKKYRAEQLAKKSASSKQAKASTQPAKQAHLEVVGNAKTIQADSNPGANGNANEAIAELKKELALAKESLTTRLKENEELKSRVFELESLLRKKNRLITLKSEQLAQLQASMATANGDSAQKTDNTTANEPVVNATSENGTTDVSAPDTTAESEKVNDNIVVNEGADIQQQVANDLANKQGEIIRGDDQLAMVTDEPMSAPAPEENTTATPETPVNNSPFVEENTDSSLDIMGLLGSPVAMGIGGGSLLALLGGLLYMRRRKSKEGEYEEFSTLTADENQGADTFADEAMMDVTPVIDESEFVAHDVMTETDSDGDAEQVEDSLQDDILQEADVYIVYGLHDQAESELKRAIEKEPENLAFRAKLLENYKAAGDKEAFEKEVRAFLDLEVDGKEKYLDDIMAWGNSLIPENKLFNGDTLKKGAAAAGVAMVAGTAVASDDDTEILPVTDEDANKKQTEDVDLAEDNLEDFDLDELLAESEMNEAFDATQELNETVASLDDYAINIDDNEDVIKDLEVELTASDDEIADIKAELDNDTNLEELDIDLSETFEFDDDDDLLEDIAETEFDSVEDVIKSVSNEIDPDDIEGQDADINLDEYNSEFELTNLNLDLDSDDLEKLLPEDSDYNKSEAAPEVSKLENNDVIEENLFADFDDNLSFLDLDDSEVIEETQIETKLDLAKAYIDMGDIEGARSTLEEVLQEGSDEQKREAEELLHQTG